jgi:hypothetical protein
MKGLEPIRNFQASRCLAAVASIEADVSRLVEGLTEEQFHAPSRLKDGGWSIGFCLEHLILTGHAFLPKWDMVLQNSDRRKPFDGNPKCTYTWLQQLALLGMQPPCRVLKWRAGAAAIPASRRSIGQTVRRFAQLQQEFARRIGLGAILCASRTPIQSPFLPWVQYPLGFSFDLAIAHEQRHLWQAWMVRRQY